MKTLKTRENFADLINEKGYTIGIEVGVRRGWFSKIILSNSKIKKWYAIDTWDMFPSITNEGSQNGDKQRAVELLSIYGERCEILQDYSTHSSLKFQDRSIDFIYIDACHTYKCVKEDIICWLPKIKIGGILAGHDYDKIAWPGVVNAVNECLCFHDILITGIGSTYGDDGGDGSRPSWYIIK